MKKSKLFVLSVAFFLFLGISSYFIYSWKHPSITKVLESDAYSYLTNEAKEYVKHVYEETGEVVLTEKNKKDNVPYLNPAYVEYLSATPEEKELMEIIPVAYAVDYEVIDKVKDTLPTSFDLRNVNSNSYVTPLKNQETMNLCWSFSTVEQIESNIMLSQNQPYNSATTQVFSTRQIDYAASTDGINHYPNENGTRELGEGGNFLTSSLIVSNGLGLIADSKMPWSKTMEQKELQDVLNYDNSLYELNTSVWLPKITSQTTSTNKAAIISLVKQFIMNYGGVYVETEGPGYSCSSTNTDGNTIIRVDDGCTQNAGHAMHIIGWMDNYSYSYCKSGNKHTSASGCSGTTVTGTGAWILRNSWGSSYSYVLLAFDSLDDNFYSFVNVSPMSERTWDNNYHKTMDSFTIYSNTFDVQTFEKKIDSTEKLEKIKFFAYGQNGTYKITVNTGSNTFTTDAFTIAYPGYNTIDLSSNNILLEDSYYEVTIVSTNGVKLLKNSMEVFTSNVDDDVIIQNQTDLITLNKSNVNYSFRLYADTKNIPSNQNVQYSLWKKSTNYSGYLLTQYTKVAENNVNPIITIGSQVPEGFYTLKETYGSVTKNVTIKIGNIRVYYYANDGTTTSSSQVVNTDGSFTLNPNTFTRTGYTFDSWNTKSNGTGTSYEDEDTMSGIDDSINLYAQWNPNHYHVHFDGNGGSNEMEDQDFTYGEATALSINTFVKTGYAFTGWNTKSNGSGTSYTDGTSITGLTAVDEATVTLYAQWSPITYTIKYSSNGGSGIMSNQTFTYDTAQTLNNNVFYRVGYTYTGWNTKNDGSGTAYTNKQSILNLTTTANEVITLYAQWSPNSYTVQFNSNGGSGSMDPMDFLYGEEKQLRENTFTKEDYLFKGWNTKSDGSGIAYTDKELVHDLVSTNHGSITLYAQWKVDMPFNITHYTVDYDNHYIDKIEAGTTLSTYQNYIELGDHYSMRIDLGDKTVLFTGSITKIYENDTLKVQFTNIIRGDINGDGKLSSLDYVKIKNHIMNTNVITDPVLQLAADANMDNKISSLDYVRIKNYIMNGGY